MVRELEQKQHGNKQHSELVPHRSEAAELDQKGFLGSGQLYLEATSVLASLLGSIPRLTRAINVKHHKLLKGPLDLSLHFRERHAPWQSV